VVEDKLLQWAVARILTPILEQDCLRCSYGYRPHVGAREAVDKLTVKLQFGAYHHVVEVDLENYFGTIDHDWLVKMLEQRIDDRPFVRLVRKWLKAGVIETVSPCSTEGSSPARGRKVELPMQKTCWGVSLRHVQRQFASRGWSTTIAVCRRQPVKRTPAP
jgi:retron-type reverse transcriptase